MENVARVGPPITARTKATFTRVHPFVLGDPRYTVRMVADELNAGKLTIYSILINNLGFKKKFAEASACTALLIRDFLPRKKKTEMEHPGTCRN